jgi:predicted N-formylglutamate amidohydrolase
MNIKRQSSGHSSARNKARRRKMKNEKGMKLLLTCEHAGNRIPSEYTALFAGSKKILSSHRGWDPGALELTRYVSHQFRTPFFHEMWSRLLVESNRSPTNPRIWSKFTSGLPADQRRDILEKYWLPHRCRVEKAVQDTVARGGSVVHIALHSFTPVLDGKIRNADIGLLYDSSRKRERQWCRNWREKIIELNPTFRVRLNYPYLGRADGLPAWLRKKFAVGRYIGIEFEFNQGLIGTPRFAELKKVAVESIRAALTDL